MKHMISALQQLLQEAPDSDAAVFIKTHLKQHRYAKHQMLFYQGDHLAYGYLVQSGIVTKHIVLDRDDAQYIDFVQPHMFFPYNGIRDDCETYSFSAQAFTDTVVWQWCRKDWQCFMSQFPEYWQYLLADMLDLQQYSDERLCYQTDRTTKERMHYVIIHMLHTFGVKEGQQLVFPYPISITDLSQLCGTTRVTASKIMQQLIDERSIIYVHKRLACVLESTE